VDGGVQFAHAREHRLVGRLAEVLDFEWQAGRLPPVTLAVLLTFALAPQLQVTPFPSVVGQPAEVRLRGSEGPGANVAVHAEPPDGLTRPIGTTDGEGRVTFVPAVPGDYVVAAQVDGVRVALPHRVVADRTRWPMAIGCLPLGLATLWLLRRERGRRGS